MSHIRALSQAKAELRSPCRSSRTQLSGLPGIAPDPLRSAGPGQSCRAAIGLHSGIEESVGTSQISPPSHPEPSPSVSPAEKVIPASSAALVTAASFALSISTLPLVEISAPIPVREAPRIPTYYIKLTWGPNASSHHFSHSFVLSPGASSPQTALALASATMGFTPPMATLM